VTVSLLPSRSIQIPLTKPASDALAYLEGVLREQPSVPAKWPSERARLTGSIAPGRIVLRLGTRHRWVVFVGQLVDGGRAISGVCKVSLPERLFFAVWYALFSAMAVLGVAVLFSAQGPAHDLKRFLAIAVAMLILGFFATRLSWLGRREHVAWIANLIRRAAH